MKRILVFNDGMEMGGTEKLLVDLLKHLASKDCIVTLLLPQPSVRNVLLDDINQSIEVKYLYGENESHIKRKVSENLMIFYPRLFAKMKGIKAANYDQVICFKDSFYARIFSKMNTRRILWVHNILYKRFYETRSLRERLSVWLNKQQIRITQKSYNKYDVVVCVSKACMEVYLDILYSGTTPNQDIRLIYNAIDLSAVVEKSKEPIAVLAQGQTNFILITRNSPEKRIDRLISAVDRLKQEGYDFHTYILGDVNDEEVVAVLEKRNLSETVSCLGRVDNPYPYILQSNWLLCVSERESFSLTLLEAMALNTPVITTNCGGPRDIVDGGRYGILVENSSEGVYRGMKMVLDDKTLMVRYSSLMGEAVQRFDYKKWLENVDEVLKLN